MTPFLLLHKIAVELTVSWEFGVGRDSVGSWEGEEWWNNNAVDSEMAVVVVVGKESNTCSTD